MNPPNVTPQLAWLQQQYAHAMSCIQTGSQYEVVGNLPAAGPHYHQAHQALSACAQVSGPNTPDDVHYWLGCCGVRLGMLTHASGNPAWAQEWMRQSLTHFQIAWQKNPMNPAYQAALGQLAVALGQVQLARQVCHQAAGNPQLAGFAQVVQGLQQPQAPQGTSGGSGGVAGQVKQWLEVGGKAVEIFKSLGDLFGGSGGGGNLGGGSWGGAGWSW